MSRLLLAVALVSLPASAWADDAKELKIIASVREVNRQNSIGPIVIDRETPTVIRSAEQLVAASNKPKSAKDAEVQKAMETAVAKLLKVEAIDWKKQMIVVGMIESVDVAKSDGKILTVTFTRYHERPARAIPPSPKVVAVIERFEGEVKFVPQEAKKEPKE